jgi:hypothetical protein
MAKHMAQSRMRIGGLNDRKPDVAQGRVTACAKEGKGKLMVFQGNLGSYLYMSG